MNERIDPKTRLGALAQQMVRQKGLKAVGDLGGKGVPERTRMLRQRRREGMTANPMPAKEAPADMADQREEDWPDWMKSSHASLGARPKVEGLEKYAPVGEDSGESPRRRGKKQVFVQYIENGNTFKPAPAIKLVPKLEAGVYSIDQTMDGEIIFEKQDVNTDDLLRFEDPVHRTILGEMDDFWSKKSAYRQKGYLHNRALLMFGPPGSGKSCIIKLAIESLVERGDVVFDCQNIRLLNEGLKKFREVESERRCLVVMEDIDERLGFEERALLQLLDGTDTADNLIYLATTNYVNRLPPRVMRPGRFGRKIEVSYPPANGRKVYLEKKLAGEKLSDKQIDEIVKETEGLSFGHLKELVTGAFILGQPRTEVIKRLKGSGLEMDPAANGEKAFYGDFSIEQIAFESKLPRATVSSGTVLSESSALFRSSPWFSEERKPTPPVERRCVADVMKKNPDYDMSRAFAICRSSMQKAGNYKSGTADLTKKGAAKSASKDRAKDDPSKTRYFQKQVKAARKD